MNFAKLAEMARIQRKTEEEINEEEYLEPKAEDEMYIPVDDEELELLPKDGYESFEDTEESLDDIIDRCFEEKAYNIELERLLPFREPIFSVDADVSQLKSSIGRIGITEPLLVRSIGSGEYEILSGNLRHKAASELLWEKIPCRIADNEKLTDKNAKRIIIESNRHRFSRLTLTEKIRAAAILGENAEKELSVSAEQAEQYACLNRLEQGFLDMLERGKISFDAAMRLSAIEKNRQQIILNVLESHSEYKLTTASIDELCGCEKELTKDIVAKIIKPKPPVKISVPAEIVAEYMGGKTSEELTEIVTMAICNYFQK